LTPHRLKEERRSIISLPKFHQDILQTVGNDRIIKTEIETIKTEATRVEGILKKKIR
jgi:hypothetical protein